MSLRLPLALTLLLTGCAYDLFGIETQSGASDGGETSTDGGESSPDGGSIGAPPEAPTGVAATRGNARATVSWTAPSNIGDGPITGYSVLSNGGAEVATTTGATLVDVVGLTNGTAYSFKVRARNAHGIGPESLESNAVTPATIPGAPTAVVATRGDASASITWTAPADNGSPIIGYSITATRGEAQATATEGTEATVVGLINGTSYTFTVRATNALGQGPESAPSNAIVPGSVPAPPRNATATAGPGSATVSWTAPSATGASPITGYRVVSDPGGIEATTVGATSVVVRGLTNGIRYSFTVRAANEVGEGLPSAPTEKVTPVDVPGAPRAVVATRGDGSATVSWTQPESDGGSPITGYSLVSTPGNIMRMTSGATSVVIGSLTIGTAYTFKVRASNMVGAGPESAASNPVTAATTPGMPTGVAAIALSEGASVSWAGAASNGGRILDYVVTSAPHGVTAAVATSPAVLAGLTAGTSYTFTVRARSEVGDGPESAASNAITPYANRDWPRWPLHADKPDPQAFTTTTDVVADGVTGLIWQRTPPTGSYIWVTASSYCSGLVLGGFEDWRLPRRVELQSIIDYTRMDPAIDTTVFRGDAGLYWTATLSSDSANDPWVGNTLRGRFTRSPLATQLSVRCVR